MLAISELSRMIGKEAVSADGQGLGEIKEFFYEESSDQPEWVGVDGSDGRKLIPVEGASIDGDRLKAGFEKSKIEREPRIELKDGLAPEEEALLVRHFGLEAHSAAAAHTLRREPQFRRPGEP